MTPTLLALALVACSDTGEATSTAGTSSTTSGATTTTGSTTPTCSAGILSVDPADGSTAVPVDAVVTATFTDPVPSAEITLVDPAGTEVAGQVTLASDGLSATFDPDADLAFETTYLAEVAACQSTTSASFTTAAAPLGAADLEGRTYAIDLNTVTWVQPDPAVIDTLIALGGGLPADQMLLQVSSVTPPDVPDTIEFLGALGTLQADGSITQYACAPVFAFDPADFTNNPSFVVGPVETQLVIQDISIPMTNLVIEGSFSGDGQEMTSGRVTADLDVRDLDEAYGVCALLELMTNGKDSCYDCGDGVIGCTWIEMEATGMSSVPGLSIDPDIDTTGC